MAAHNYKRFRFIALSLNDCAVTTTATGYTYVERRCKQLCNGELMKSRNQIASMIFCCLIGVYCSYADDNSQTIEKLMKSCIIPVVEFKENQTILDAMRFFRDYKPIEERAKNVGVKFDFRFRQPSDWEEGDDGKKISEKILPFKASNITYFNALKKVCLNNGYRFRIENGVVRVTINNIAETKPRNWTSAKGSKLYGKWVGLLATGEGVVVKRESDGELIPAFYKNLSKADKKVVNVPGDRDFMPYYYQVGHKKILVTDHIICSEQEARQEQRYIDRATDLIFKKSYPDMAKYKVLQSLGNGALCVLKRRHRNGQWEDGYQGELFYMLDSNMADEDCYSSEWLLWVGTYTYETVSGQQRTVNAYTDRSLLFAVDVVRDIQHLYNKGDPRFDADSQAGSRSGGSTFHGSSSDGGEPQLSSSGSGVIITQSGYLLTNEHVVKGARKILVKTTKGDVNAKVIRVDANNDLALLKLEGNDFMPIAFSSRRTERLGASVFTLGFPRPTLQGFEPKVTKGVISGMEGFQGDVKTYQIDAAIQPGNSGGLLADMNGNLVGVVCSALVYAGEGQALPQNVNYAIKKSYVLAFLDAVPECADEIEERSAKYEELEQIVENVRESCALILVYE